MKIPTKKECFVILNKNKTPSNVIEHSKAVCRVAERIADRLIKRGVKVNKKLVIAAALLHDIERAEDNHVIRGFRLLSKLGYKEVANTMRKHSLYKVGVKNNQPKTWEEKIIFYADKRCIGSRAVSLKKRFDALEKRYKINLSNEFKFTKNIEKGLLGKN
jgi:putative nucleotidyltransferase with HDIG domain